MKTLRSVFSLLAFQLILSATAIAQVPHFISYQGQATGSNNAPLTGMHTVRVAIFGSADTTTATLLSANFPGVQFVNGVFGVMISVPDVSVFSMPVFLAAGIDGGPLMTPPALVMASPYAFYSEQAGHARVADSLTTPITRLSLGAAASGTNSDIHTLNGLTTPLAISEGGTGATSLSGIRIGIGAAASGSNSDITSLNGLTTPLPASEGGTGATSLAGLRTNIGAAASGSNSDITSLTGLTTAVPIGSGGTGASTAANARINLGLGSMATQAASGVAITGGAIDGTPIGATTPANVSAAAFKYSGNIYTMGSEVDNATNGNTVMITGSVPIATIMKGAATGIITATVTNSSPGQWLYVLNLSTFTVVFSGINIANNTAAQFLNVAGAWWWVQ